MSKVTAVRERLRSSVERRGLIRTSAVVVREAAIRLRSLVSDAWKMSADLFFDLRHNVSTASVVEVQHLGLHARFARSSSVYQPTSTHLFHRAVGGIHVRHEGYTFVDYGSGKGKCLLMASSYPFRRIIGVELSAPMIEVAQKNLASFRSSVVKCSSIEVKHISAADFVPPFNPCLHYFYAPFDSTILERVIENIGRSLAVRPRTDYVVFVNPANVPLLDEVPWLKLLERGSHYAVYSSIQEMFI